MDSKTVVADKPHAVCVPIPVQSHIKAMLKFSKLLHHKGFHITFVNTEFNHQRFLKSGGPNSLDGLPDFQFKTIPDSLPPSDSNATQDLISLTNSIMKNFLAPFFDLLVKLNTATSNNPPVTCIISDGFLAFTIKAAQELKIPILMLFTVPACSLMGFMQFLPLRDKGLTPLKDECYLTNGYLDTVIDWIPGMRDIRLRDLPSYVRTTDPNDVFFKFFIDAMESAPKASGIIIHTFDALEQEVLDALSPMFSRIHAIGPLQLLLNHLPNDPLKSIRYSLWEEETECLRWLNNKAPNSVVFVNFGSIAVMTPLQLTEFGWGLANSKHPFLWIIRPDLVVGESAVLPPEFMVEIKNRGLIAGWCPQEEVLHHPSIGGFLTHCGWNSIIESVCAGVPMLCWPFFADQQMNCKYTCNEWGIGLEINNGANREEVGKLVRELMEGDVGESFDNLNESDMLSSKNGPLLSLSSAPKFYATSAPGPREKEIVELFRKVQAQLRERAASKEEKKTEALQGQGKESETVDSLLKLLRKHSGEQSKRSSRSNGSNKNSILEQPVQNDPYNEGKSTNFYNSNSSLKNDAQEPNASFLSRPLSNFRRKSPVPRVKYQPIYSGEDPTNTMPHVNSSERREENQAESDLKAEKELEPEFTLKAEQELEPELEAESELESEPELELEPEPEPKVIFPDGGLAKLSEGETSDMDEPYNDKKGGMQPASEHRDLSALKLPELRALAKSRGVKGYSKMKKSELVELLTGSFV